MDEEKNHGLDNLFSQEDDSDERDQKAQMASRARNRTVMLTPEMTGQMRALFQPDLHGEGEHSGGGAKLEDFLPPVSDWEALSGDASKSESETARGIPEETANGLFEKPDSTVENPYRKPTGGMERQGSFFGEGLGARSRQPKSLLGGETEQEVSSRSAPPPPAFSVNRSAIPKSMGTSASATSTRAPRAPLAASSRQTHQGPVVHSGSVKTRIVGFLVSFDTDSNGEVFEIRTGRWLLTSRPTDHGDYILVNDESISPLHAILRATKEGRLQVLDQLSEFGTGVTRAGQQEEVEIAGGLETVNHGDILRFGQRKFVVCCVPQEVTVQAEPPAETKQENS